MKPSLNANLAGSPLQTLFFCRLTGTVACLAGAKAKMPGQRLAGPGY
jgi:hypothetical protein